MAALMRVKVCLFFFQNCKSSMTFQMLQCSKISFFQHLSGNRSYFTSSAWAAFRKNARAKNTCFAVHRKLHTTCAAEKKSYRSRSPKKGLSKYRHFGKKNSDFDDVYNELPEEESYDSTSRVNGYETNEKRHGYLRTEGYGIPENFVPHRFKRYDEDYETYSRPHSGSRNSNKRSSQNTSLSFGSVRGMIVRDSPGEHRNEKSKHLQKKFEKDELPIIRRPVHHANTRQELSEEINFNEQGILREKDHNGKHLEKQNYELKHATQISSDGTKINKHKNKKLVVAGNKLSKKGSKKIKYVKKGEYVFGLYPVLNAMLQKKRTIYRLFLDLDVKRPKYHKGKVNLKVVKEIIRLAKEREVSTRYVVKSKLQKLLDHGDHESVVLDAEDLPVLPLSLEKAMTGDSTANKMQLEPQVWIVLHETRDPMNVGNIMNAAHHSCVDKILTSKSIKPSGKEKFGCILSPVTSFASGGSMETLDISYVEDLLGTLQHLKENSWDIVGTTCLQTKRLAENKMASKLDAQTSLDITSSNDPATNNANDKGLKSSAIKCVHSLSDFKLQKNTILLVGNEELGLSDEFQSVCTSFVTVPPGRILDPGVDSLNAGIATGIILYALCMQRRLQNPFSRTDKSDEEHAR